MTGILATNITSPLGLDSLQNYASVRRGGSALHTLDGWEGVPERVCVGAFSPRQREDLAIPGFTRFQSLVIRSVSEALKHTDVDLSSGRTVFILSTTKGDVGELAADPADDGEYLAPGAAARKIAAYFGITTEPLVVCNACISGVTAQLLADRLISAGEFDTAIVCGADVLSAFTLAGFTSFKSLSPVECRPFDIERLGLNLGEAAATMILGRQGGSWRIVSGCLDNDAYHVSAPSPDGEGVLRAIRNTLADGVKGRLATVSAHGTATMFNDQMESRAIAGAGLGDIPVSAYKGCFGHTLGASGILESVITMCSVDDGVVLPVRGFEEAGVSGRINVCDRETATDGGEFLKIISGFGGCNGAVLYSKLPAEKPAERISRRYGTVHSVSITPDAAVLDGAVLPVVSRGQALLTELFRSRLEDCQKFYKMDLFSRLVFVAAGMLLKEGCGVLDPATTAVVLFNASSSVIADRQHLGTFPSAGEFYPSPSVFLYTLPNVVLGELAATFGIKGETTFIILAQKDGTLMNTVVDATLAATAPSAVITGWADCSAEDSFEADLKLMKLI